jgi:transcriptional regulator with XRE-family HTH domain
MSKILSPKKSLEAIDIAVGGQILKQRQVKGLSQTQLAEYVGVSYQQIQKYETGVNRPKVKTLQKLAEALEVPVTYFFAPEAIKRDIVPKTISLPTGISVIESREILTLMSKITNPKLKKHVINLLREFVA